MVGRKGQTRNWLITASLPARGFGLPQSSLSSCLTILSSMSERNSFVPTQLLTAPFVLGTAALEMTLLTTVSLARLAQITVQSADTALAKYIELTEQEIEKGRRRESVKVE